MKKEEEEERRKNFRKQRTLHAMQFFRHPVVGDHLRVQIFRQLLRLPKQGVHRLHLLFHRASGFFQLCFQPSNFIFLRVHLTVLTSDLLQPYLMNQRKKNNKKE